MNDLIFCLKKIFLSYIVYNEQLLTFGFPSLQKYFFKV